MFKQLYSAANLTKCKFYMTKCEMKENETML